MCKHKERIRLLKYITVFLSYSRLILTNYKRPSCKINASKM